MKSILFYLGITLLIEYGLGFGLARLVLPEKLKKYSLMMGPWILNVSVIIVLVITSLLGLRARLISYIIAVVLGILFLKERKTFKIGKTDWILLLIVGVTTLVHNSPLLLREKFLTTISAGNNDIIAYATNADYLLDKSILDNLSEAVILPIANLLQDGYRWGTPLLLTFFLALTRLEAWQMAYITQTILFVTMVPLAYVLWERWYGRKSESWWVALLIAFNANLAYMMYHNFFGQVVFWGIFLTIVILATEYFERAENKTEWLVGGGIAAMYMAYHEPAIFVLAPFAFTAMWMKRWQGLLRIAGIAALLAGISIINATIFDFGQAFKGNPEQPIGWQIFRAISPTSNPWELAGMTSVHTDQPLPIYLAWGLSMLVVFIWGWGVYKSRVHHYVWLMMVFFAGLLWWTAMGKNGNWFVFNRAATYILPVLVVVWTGGIVQFPKWVKYGVMVLITVMVMRTGIRLNQGVVNTHLTVHSWYQTAKEVRELEIKEPIFNSGHLSSGVSIWDQNWTGYFLYSMVNEGTLPQVAIKNHDLILMNKSTPWVQYPGYVLTDVQWENAYYQLGRICLDDECLLSSGVKLDQVVFGDSEYEDNLIISGWASREKDGRWTTAKEARLKLWSYLLINYTKIEIEVQTIVPDQQIQILVDGIESTKLQVGTEWKVLTIPVHDLVSGWHEISVRAEYLGSPSLILGNSDARQLGVRLRSVKLF